MADLIEEQITGYGTILQYIDNEADLVVTVNSRKDFKKGLKDSSGNNNLMTLEQAEEAKIMPISEYYGPEDDGIPRYIAQLEMNGFELIPE